MKVAKVILYKILLGKQILQIDKTLLKNLWTLKTL